MHIGLQTEYSFKKCYGRVPDILDKVKSMGHTFAGIADFGNTFGHVVWEKECNKRGIKPLFGVRLNVVPEGSKQRRCDTPYVIFAKNQKGLAEIHKLVELSYEMFYYIPRVFFSDLGELKHCNFFSSDKVPLNRYTNPEDYELYQTIAGSVKRGDDYNYMFEDSTEPRHILTTDELIKYYPTMYSKSSIIPSGVSLVIPKTALEIKLERAGMVKFEGKHNIDELCIIGALNKEVDLDDPIYKARLKRELDLIKEKDYVDYFLITADMIKYAKDIMMVGPSRGSSAGSLVCYLLSITEVDPIPYDLIFERFIDINRFDLPDIDIDFPDVKRHLVIEYLSDKYGSEKVRTLANISRLKPKSAIDAIGKAIGIPKYELEDVKGAIIERSGGDARAAMCVADTFDTTQPGKEITEKYPDIALTAEIEGHASHSGKHAAGVLVSTLPLWHYGSVNSRDDIIQLDKSDATELNLLKIDCLGLRTLTILQQASELAGFNYKDFYKMKLDDEDTFKIFNDHRFSGVFQFEGYSLQGLVKEMIISHFNDISVITALGRPGPLNSGGALAYTKIHSGKEPVKYLSEHPAIIKNTKETLGIIVYQEQLMNIGREYGGLSWADVSELRKAASKSLGEEFFGKFKNNFMDGTRKKGVDDKEAEYVWENMITFGSWGFNKSHAVAYGLISYWTAYMKAHHPLEFYTASLNNSKDETSAIRLLRDLVLNEGIEYTPVDADESDINWSIKDGKLLGGLTNIKGIADKKARGIINARLKGKGFTPSVYKMLSNPLTPYDDIFPCNTMFGYIINDYKKYGFKNKPVEIKTIETGMTKDIIFIGRLEKVNLRDLNEYELVEKRGGEKIERNTQFLNLAFEDDTDSIICSIGRMRFNKINAIDIVEKGVIGESWYLIAGKVDKNWRKVNINEIVNVDKWRKK